MAKKTLHQGKFVWFELVTRDVEKAKGFYGELFGWAIAPMPGMDGYQIAKSGEQSVGGLTAPQGDAPAHWHAYVSVADVDAAAKAAKGAGGKVLAEPFDVPGVGRMAALADPQGATFSVFSAEQGDGEDPKAGVGQFFWNELWAKDDLAATTFYERVCGWSYGAMDMGPAGVYRIAKSGGVDRAGIMRSPDPKAPVMWLPYVRVADCDASTARAKKLGGEVIAAPSDIPNVGRFAIVKDPTGAVIAIMKSFA